MLGIGWGIGMEAMMESRMAWQWAPTWVDSSFAAAGPRLLEAPAALRLAATPKSVATWLKRGGDLSPFPFLCCSQKEETLLFRFYVLAHVGSHPQRLVFCE